MDNPTGADLDQLMEELDNAVAGSPGSGQPGPGAAEPGQRPETLSSDEKDLLGEIGNICMGTAATTLSSLLGKKVSITTPRVSVAYTVQDLGYFQKPFLAVEVSYTEGVDGYNILLMQDYDVKVITDILMGGEGKPDPDMQMDELHFSALSEVMNQMVGSSSTSLSNLLGRTVNITPPRVKPIVMENEDLSTLVCHDDIIIKIAFDIEIENTLRSEMLQLIPYTFGKQMALDMMFPEGEPEPPPPPPPPPPPKPAAPPVRQQAPVQTAPPTPAQREATMQQSESRTPQQAQTYHEAGGQPQGVTSLHYASFDDSQMDTIPGVENIGLILDVPLQITVELGQCKRSIKDILGFTMGSVIVLDRLAGEMVDIMVNGKLFARGEVVVIDDNYGVRVTDIVAMPQV